MYKKLILIALFVLTLSAANSAERVFAIVVDSTTYQNCRSEIDNYSLSLQNEGFTTLILSRVWETPMQLRDSLFSIYKQMSLVGAIFIGDIPIAMIRDAQHLTSAFKMDQGQFPMIQSSVPSDRYYDDFNLVFNYIGRDSSVKNLFYFSLSGSSPQKISSSIYSGRVKPTKDGEDGYEQIRRYFRKVVDQKREINIVDNIVSYTGEGSFSNSMTAWKDEIFILNEQFPEAFKSKDGLKMFYYDMAPYMKDLVIDQLRREEVDLFYFHMHGMPYRQYLTSLPLSKGGRENISAAKRLFRDALRKESSQNKRDSLKNYWQNLFFIDSTWFDGYNSKEMIKNDSLDDINMGIVLEDIPNINPNARVTIFDACYNGDFREKSFIAGEYILSNGKSVIGIANSVNVLQDKSSSDLMGLLNLGFSIGEVMQQTNILESHIIGDPTFCFSSDVRDTINLYSKNISYWLDVLKSSNYPDIKALALYKLSDLKYSDIEPLLRDIYCNSPFYTLRLQAFNIHYFYCQKFFGDMLLYSVNDQYEYIRRKSLFFMGKIGEPRFIPTIIQMYLYNYLDARVKFNALFAFDNFEPQLLIDEFDRQLQISNSIIDKKRVRSEFISRIESRKSIMNMVSIITDKTKNNKVRLNAIRVLRNNNYHMFVDDYLELLRDPSESELIKSNLVEALGWFVLSYKRSDILAACKKELESEIGDEYRDQLQKTVLRLSLFVKQ